MKPNRSALSAQYEELLQRITTNQKIFGGKPIIRGHRIAVEHILGMIANGESLETILVGYPQLYYEDVLACFAYAVKVIIDGPQSIRYDFICDLARLVGGKLAQIKNGAQPQS